MFQELPAKKTKNSDEGLVKEVRGWRSKEPSWAARGRVRETEEKLGGGMNEGKGQITAGARLVM